MKYKEKCVVQIIEVKTNESFHDRLTDEYNYTDRLGTQRQTFFLQS